MDATIAVRYGLGLVMLAGALVPDLRTRRVPNQWWIPFGVAAALLAVGDVAQPPAERNLALLWLAIAAAVAGFVWGLWRIGLFGGADAKALMVLAFLVPRPAHAAGLAIPPAFDALANGSLAMLLLPFLFLLANLMRGQAALPAMLLGTRMDVKAARAKHVWPMQTIDEAGQLKWRFWQRIGLPLDEAYAALERAGVAQVWVTPKVPFIAALLVGLAASAAWGNLVVLAATRLM